MRNHRVYIDDDLYSGANLSLSKEISHYIHTVLRLKSGYKLHVFNGDGQEYNATITIDKKLCSLTVEELARDEEKNKRQIHLIQAIARGDHMDFAIQKATELGVDVITPVIASRTQSHDKFRLEKRFTHWQKIIIHACEQSGRCYLPTLKPISEYTNAIDKNSDDIKFICEPCNKAPQALPGSENITVLVGPEGGLSQEEIELAKNADYMPLSLGKNILRTETAATSALTLISYLLR